LEGKVTELIEKNESRYLEELKEFVKIPSISADPEKVEKITECANWVKNQMDNMGMEKSSENIRSLFYYKSRRFRHRYRIIDSQRYRRI